MNIGRKIYYAKSNGVVLWDKGEMSGAVVQTTFEQDKLIMPILAALPESEIGVIEYDYGTLMKAVVLVNTNTLELITLDRTIEPLVVEKTTVEKLAELEAKIDNLLNNQYEKGYTEGQDALTLELLESGVL